MEGKHESNKVLRLKYTLITRSHLLESEIDKMGVEMRNKKECVSSTTSHEEEKWLRLKGSGFALTKWRTPLAAKCM